MKPPRLLLTALGFLALALMTASCATSHRQMALEPQAELPRTRIGGYTTAEGNHVAYDGYVRSEGDSLKFEPRTTGKMGSGAPLTLAASEVRSLDMSTGDAGRTAWGWTLGLVIAAAFLATALLFGPLVSG